MLVPIAPPAAAPAAPLARFALRWLVGRGGDWFRREFRLGLDPRLRPFPLGFRPPALMPAFVVMLLPAVVAGAPLLGRVGCGTFGAVAAALPFTLTRTMIA